jgi:hypothetical protein
MTSPKRTDEKDFAVAKDRHSISTDSKPHKNLRRSAQRRFYLQVSFVWICAAALLGFIVFVRNTQSGKYHGRGAEIGYMMDVSAQHPLIGTALLGPILFFVAKWLLRDWKRGFLYVNWTLRPISRQHNPKTFLIVFAGWTFGLLGAVYLFVSHLFHFGSL